MKSWCTDTYILSCESTPFLDSPFYTETTPTPHGVIISSEEREMFTSDLCKLFIVANIAWWAVEIPYVKDFFWKWMKVDLPGRKLLAGRALDQEVGRVQERMKAEVHHRFATGQCDGWKNVSRDSIIASMANVKHKVS